MYVVQPAGGAVGCYAWMLHQPPKRQNPSKKHLSPSHTEPSPWMTKPLLTQPKPATFPSRMRMAVSMPCCSTRITPWMALMTPRTARYSSPSMAALARALSGSTLGRLAQSVSRCSQMAPCHHRLTSSRTTHSRGWMSQTSSSSTRFRRAFLTRKMKKLQRSSSVSTATSIASQSSSGSS